MSAFPQSLDDAEGAPEAPAAEPAADQGSGVVDSIRERGELADSLNEGRWDVLADGVRELAAEVVRFLPLVLLAVLVFVLFTWLASVVGRWQAPYRRLAANPFVRDLIRQGVKAAVFVTGVLLALEILNATGIATAVLGTAGVVGLAVGFAFKDLVENYIAGILLSVRQPFAPNEHVVIDGQEGKVIRLTSRAAILMTLDGNHLRIPNAQVFKGVMLNYSRNSRRRFTFTVGVGTAEDIPEAIRLGVDVMKATPGVLTEPTPEGLTEALGDSSVLVRFHGWVDQASHDFLRTRSLAVLRVKDALEEQGMDLPEPIYRLRMEGAARSALGAPSQATVPEAPKPSRRKPAGTATDEEAEVLETEKCSTAGTDAIDHQIAEERAGAPAEEDLLHPTAPRE